MSIVITSLATAERCNDLASSSSTWNAGYRAGVGGQEELAACYPELRVGKPQEELCVWAPKEVPTRAHI